MRSLIIAIFLLLFIPAGGMTNKSYSINGFTGTAYDVAPNVVYISSKDDLRYVFAAKNKRYVINDSFDLRGKTVRNCFEMNEKNCYESL